MEIYRTIKILKYRKLKKTRNVLIVFCSMLDGRTGMKLVVELGISSQFTNTVVRIKNNFHLFAHFSCPFNFLHQLYNEINFNTINTLI